MKYYINIGQNMSVGTPNAMTGRMSMYGDLIAFRSKKERDVFFDNKILEPSETMEKCSKTSARKFNMGMTIREFDEYIEIINAQSYDPSRN